MSSPLQKPGDSVEGTGHLLQHGRFVARVDYHLAVPNQTHFFVNPTGKVQTDYSNYIAGFILLAPEDARQLNPETYTLELADKTKLPVQIERRYRETNRNGQPRISFYVKIAPAGR
jgi:hypothetical protein